MGAKVGGIYAEGPECEGVTPTHDEKNHKNLDLHTDFPLVYQSRLFWSELPSFREETDLVVRHFM